MLRLMPGLILTALLLVAPAVQAGDATRHGKIEISDPWVRLTIPGRPAAGYLTATNQADAPDRLLNVRATDVETVELHETRMSDGVMRMSPVEAVEIPPHGTAELKPGGAHIMMFGTAGLKVGATVDLVLNFEHAGEVTVTAPVVKRAPEGKAGHGHSGHSGHDQSKD